jgi:uncharacterized protein
VAGGDGGRLPVDEQKRFETVMELYAAFGRGDIPGVLERLTQDVDWWVAGPEIIPYAGAYHGHAGVGEFFARLAASIEMQKFEPREFIVQSEQIVVLGHEEGCAIPTGCSFENDWAHVFTFRDQRVERFREFGDTAALASAFGASRAE